MGAGFWISRYLLASGSALAWSLVASAIFIGSKYWRYRKAMQCATCSDASAGSKPKA